MITFESVTKSYDGTIVVNDLSLQIPDGKITVFVGPSGCGKTTTLRMINRMVEPTAGHIRIDDTDIRTISPPELRRGIGYVIQHAGLFPHKRIIDNIATVPRLNGVSRADARDHALELMNIVGLDQSLARRFPAQLSGGQQQRVGVARALAADPPILLMDEPFSAVDPLVRDSLQRQLLDIQQQMGKTIVFVTHDIEEAIRIGDQIAILQEGGTLVQVAAPVDLLREPANEFVRTFVGYDRGIRSLSFVPADVLRPHADPSNGNGWQVVLDDQHRPSAWRNAGGESAVIDDSVAPGDTLRRALDAALLSHTGYAVAVDGDGRYLGIFDRHDVLRAIPAAES